MGETRHLAGSERASEWARLFEPEPALDPGLIPVAHHPQVGKCPPLKNHGDAHYHTKPRHYERGEIAGERDQLLKT